MFLAYRLAVGLTAPCCPSAPLSRTYIIPPVDAVSRAMHGEKVQTPQAVSWERSKADAGLGVGRETGMRYKANGSAAMTDLPMVLSCSEPA